MEPTCPRCGSRQELPMRRSLWRSGGRLVCRACYGPSIERELRRRDGPDLLRVLATVVLAAALVLAVAVLGPAGRHDDGRPSPAECVTQGARAC